MTDFWNQGYFKVSKISASIVGQWPLQSFREYIFFRGILVILTIIQLIPRSRAVIFHTDDPEIVFDAVGPFIIDTVFVIKTINNWCNFNKMKDLLMKIEENWEIFTDDELKILHQYTAAGKKLSIIYFGSVFGGGAVFATEPIQLRIVHTFIPTNKTLPLFPMPVDYGAIDVEKYYIPLLFLSETTTLLIVLGIIACDMLFFIYCYHIFGLFETLGLASHVEQLYIWNFLSVVGLNMIIISISAVQIVVNLHVIEKVVQYSSLTVSQLGHLFVECLLGQRLIDYSLGIQNHICNAKWFNSSIKAQKLLSLLLMRSQRQCQLTAGKMLVMDYETFNMIIRASASYFTVILATQ